jgi:hypothetical protein
MDWFVFKFLLVFVSIYFFCIGLMLMDYGATFKEKMIGQSLIFENIEPRIMYHLGLLLVTGSFMLLTMLCAYYLSWHKNLK